MATLGTLRYDKLIISCFICFFIAFFSPVVSYAQTENEENCVEVSSFDEFILSLNQIQSTGGTIVLTQDITVPAEESYTYNNGRYRKEVTIETNGHTIHVEGYLELWPFLTIRGDGSQKELLHVLPGGELRLISVCLDASENGIAVIQDEGAFLMYGSEEGTGLPMFSCTGEIISSQTTTAAAYWRYNCEKLPIIRVPEGTDFTADMLPDQVLSIVNRDHQEFEEEIPVVWDETTFPTEHKRTLVQGKFSDEYSPYKDYMPLCLVVWESDTSPFFLNVYLESATQWYDMIFMYGESPQAGTIYVQSSEDGETWIDISGTDGYAPAEVEENASFSWILSYDLSDSAQERPRYYRLLQILDDGTELYSDALELSDEFIFTAADIEGGRGGETSPNEGDDELPNDISEIPSLESPDTSSEQETNIGSNDSAQSEEGVSESEEDPVDDKVKNLFYSNQPTVVDHNPLPGDSLTAVQPEENEETLPLEESPQPEKQTGNIPHDTGSTEKIIGIAIVLCILAGSVTLSVFKRKR